MLELIPVNGQTPVVPHYKPPRSALTADSTESTHTSMRKLSAILCGHTHGKGQIFAFIC